MTNQLITILARKGSKRLPNKALLKIDVRPLISHTVEQATNYACQINQKNENNICAIILSTDSDEIIKMHENEIVTFKRSSELCQDDTPKMESIRDAVEWAEDYYSLKFEMIIDLDVTNPMRTVEDIENAYNLFGKHKPFSLISVVRPRRLMGFNIINLGSTGKVYMTESVFNQWDMNASLLLLDRDWLMHGNDNHPVTEHGRGTTCYIMPDFTAFDIDEKLDYEIVKMLMERK